MAEQRPSSKRKVDFIALEVVLVLGMFYSFTYARGLPLWVQTVLAFW